MMQRQVSKTLTKTIGQMLKTKTYAETARTLTKRGFKTPRGRKLTPAFINYIRRTYLN